LNSNSTKFITLLKLLHSVEFQQFFSSALAWNGKAFEKHLKN